MPFVALETGLKFADSSKSSWGTQILATLLVEVNAAVFGAASKSIEAGTEQFRFPRHLNIRRHGHLNLETSKHTGTLEQQWSASQPGTQGAGGFSTPKTFDLTLASNNIISILRRS